jgi:xanthine dehydrogenase accessory factor
MNHWVQMLKDQLIAGQELILVSMIVVRGSAPREAGARMLVTRERSLLTIGGGHLEWRAIAIARGMLDDGVDHHQQPFSLGASLGQCCGGAVELLFQRIVRLQPWIEQTLELLLNGRSAVLVHRLDAADQSLMTWLLPVNERDWVCDSMPAHLRQVAERFLLRGSRCSVEQAGSVDGDDAGRYWLERVEPMPINVFVFGAGHVGQALVRSIGLQPWNVRWIDTRDEVLPTMDSVLEVETITTDTPEVEVSKAPPNSYFVVLTHDHALDFRLTMAILQRNDFAYFGLIGSRSKRVRFEHRLRERGVTAQQLLRMTCPIGIDGIRSKHPAAIALAVGAQLLRVAEAHQTQALSRVTNQLPPTQAQHA